MDADDDDEMDVEDADVDEEGNDSDFKSKILGVLKKYDYEDKRSAKLTQNEFIHLLSVFSEADAREVYTWGWKECIPSGKVFGEPSTGGSLEKDAVSDIGQVWGWGYGVEGQLGFFCVCGIIEP